MGVGEGRAVALTGFMAVGKSTAGPLVADRLGLPFVDVDDELERTAGRPVASWFPGEVGAFRALEAATIARLLEGPPTVLALGGGALLDPATRGVLRERARLVYLEVPWPELASRLESAAAGRPLLAGRPLEEAAALYEARLAAYREAPFRVAAGGGRTPAEVADAVVAALGAGPG